MNQERKKAVLTLTGTLIIGILVGLLVPGLFHKMRARDHRGEHEEHGGTPEDKKEWFTQTIYRILQPDSIQVKQITPITEWAARSIDSLEVTSNHQLASILDSVKSQLKPFITEEQFKRLNDFDNKAKGHWRGKGRGGERGKHGDKDRARKKH